MTILASSTRTVLVADDAAFVRDRFRAALEAAGHRALTVRNTAELLAVLRSHSTGVDLLLLDLRLPDANGVEVIKAIREVDGGRTPLLIFSGSVASASEVRELATLRVAGYVNEYSAVQHISASLAPHLFPQESNRRGSPRVVLGIPIAYRVGHTIAAALTLNLSPGGVAIRTTGPLPVGSLVRVRFRLPGSKRDLDLEARVSWSDDKLGMGLEFTAAEGSAAERASVEEFVIAHAADV